MNLTVKYIRDAGNLEKERIVFNVIENLNLGKFIVFTSGNIQENSFSANLKNSYWFNDLEVKKGDLVILYSHSGTYSVDIHKNGETKSHFFYRNLEKSLFVDESSGVVLIESLDWQAKKDRYTDPKE